MKKHYLPLFLLLFSIAFYKNSGAQKTTDEESTSKSSYFKLGLNYQTDNVYLGRKDSVKVPYLTPSIGYYDKSGFYISGSLSYLPSSGENRIDLFNIEGGYSFEINKLEGGISFSKDFYSLQSFSVKSEVTASSIVSLGYDLGFIKPSLGGGITFGTKNDYSITGGLEHGFSAANDKLSITPSLTFNASTQNYYNSYYEKRKYAQTRKGKNVAYNITATALDVARFKVMDYEFSLPIEYAVNKLTFNFSPTMVFPTNPNQVLLSVKSGSGPSYSKTYTEKLSNVFFSSFEVSFKF